MTDDRVVMMSATGYRNLVNPQNGKGLHWTSDINDELPIKMRQSGPGSEVPFTMPQLFMNAVRSGQDRPALFVERGGKRLSWTWNEYYKDAMAFAKGMTHLNCSARSGVAIMGFNSPEWVIGWMGAVLAKSIPTGIYITN